MTIQERFLCEQLHITLLGKSSLEYPPTSVDSLTFEERSALVNHYERCLALLQGEVTKPQVDEASAIKPVLLGGALE